MPSLILGDTLIGLMPAASCVTLMGILNTPQCTQALLPVPQGAVSSSITMASLPVPTGNGVFQLIWKDWFAPPAAVHACCCGIGLPLLKAVLVTVRVAGGVLVGTVLGFGAEVGLGAPPFHTPPPQAGNNKPLMAKVQSAIRFRAFMAASQKMDRWLIYSAIAEKRHDF